MGSNQLRDAMEKFLCSWWKRILVFLLLICIIFLPLHYIFNDLAFNYVLFYYYYDPSISLLIALFISSLIIERNRSGKYFWTFGLSLTKQTIHDIILSFIITFIPFLLLSASLYLLEVNVVIDINIFSNLLYFIFIILVYSANEELIFRGIIFQAILGKFGIISSIFLSSLSFAIVHLDNSSFNTIAFVNTFIAGIVLGVMYIQTKSLYLPISFHFFWNFLQHLILGSNISGNSFGFSIIQVDFSILPVWLFGGNYGIEGGLAGTICLLLALSIVLRYSKPSPFITSKLLKRDILENI